MKMDELAKKILEIVGKNNITYLTHCATRLRLNVKDEAAVNLNELDKLEGVIKSQFKGGQLQIIIGAKVKAAFDALSSIVNLNDDNIKATTIKKNVIASSYADSKVLATEAMALRTAAEIKERIKKA